MKPITNTLKASNKKTSNVKQNAIVENALKSVKSSRPPIIKKSIMKNPTLQGKKDNIVVDFDSELYDEINTDFRAFFNLHGAEYTSGNMTINSIIHYITLKLDSKNSKNK